MRVQATDPIVGMHIGEIELNTHKSDQCSGEFCVVHNPSDHHMREWPLLWRGDKGVMERTCSHGIGHPDPDDARYLLSVGRSYLLVHGCDLCCSAPASGMVDNPPGEVAD